MAQQTHTSADFPLPPTGTDDGSGCIYRQAADAREVQTITETSADGSEAGSTRPEGSGAEGKLAALRVQLARNPGQPIDVGRYTVLRCLGWGGMGVVYEAVTRDRSRRVALKTLQRMSAAGLYRFKNEFRSAQSVSHRNLVALYELVAEDDEWFFTMECLEGEAFEEWVRPGARAAGARMAELGDTQIVSPDGESAETEELEEPSLRRASMERPRARPAFDEVRLRDGLRQLAAGVHALHQAGKVHRDLNSGNVIVTREGRVVVLDFGLIGNDTSEGERGSFDNAGGTPGYMAPEQAQKRASAASDWYAVGVLLYEALTGELPFTGPVNQVLRAKQSLTPAPPRTLVAGVPEDLDALCMDLLRREPLSRPTGPDVLLRLCEPGSLGAQTELPAPSIAPSFIGRRDELRALSAAFDASAGKLPGEARRPVAVHVQGPSGMGKSALVAHFLDDLEARGEALVLRGRCYERESLPFKAFDALVDSLTHHLRSLPEEAARALLPPDVLDLARLFPVLHGVSAVAAAPRRRFELRDPQELRRRAFGCLKELCARLGAARPLVLSIDDLQWGDVDSARLLGDLLSGPALSAEGAAEPPPLLLVMAYRGDEIAESPLSAEIARMRSARPEVRPMDTRGIPLGPLSPAEATELSLLRLGRHGEAARASAAAIARESEGNPFFVEELARCAAWSGAGPDRALEGLSLSLGKLVEARLGHLPGPARRLLEVIAVAGHPLPQGLALEVAGAGAEAHAAMHALRTGRLVRTRGFREGDPVEIAHDRIRAAVAERIAPGERCALHLALGRALHARRAAEPERLALHFEQGDALAEAADHYAAAAEKAAAALAFDRAAEHYRRALDYRPRTARERRELCERRADALVSAGRSAEAAPSYLAAAEGAPAPRALDLRRRAAEQLLVSGHVDEGVSVLCQVLKALGLRYPESRREAELGLSLRLAHLRLRGTRRAEASRRISADERGKIGACWSASRGLSGIDPLRSAAFAVHGLLLALAAGDERHVVLGLAASAAGALGDGSPAAAARTGARLAEAERLALRSGDPYLVAFTGRCAAEAHLGEGRYREALRRADEAAALLGERCAGADKERSACRAIALAALLGLGELRERSRRALGWLWESADGSDRFAQVEAALGFAPARLIAGEPEQARAEARAAIARWSPGSYSTQHLATLRIEIAADLYEADPESAWARVSAAFPALRRADLRRAREEALRLRAVSAVALAARPHRRDAALLLATAEEDAAALAREGRPHPLAASALIRAGIARVMGRIALSAALLGEASHRYREAEMKLMAAVAERRLGTLLGDEGRDRVAAADEALRAEEIRDPERWTAMTTGLAR